MRSMHPILLLLFLPLASCQLFSGLFEKRCKGKAKRCFFLTGSRMHEGVQGSDSCRDAGCILFPSLRPTLSCGTCDDNNIESSNPPSAAPSITSSYDIQIEFNGIPSEDEGLFNSAISRWTRIIVGDVPPRSGLDALNAPPSGCSYPDDIDDLYVCAQYTDIDGAGGIGGNVLGSAQPIWLRGSTFLPIASSVIFDNFDLDFLKSNGNFDAVILHELAHCIGFGTVWDRTNITGPFAEGCMYNGTRANTEYSMISDCATIPIQLSQQTRCQHWSESCLGNELMTPILNEISNENPLSRITIAAFEDLGYDVDYTTADSFTSSDVPCSLCTSRNANAGRAEHETVNSGVRTMSATAYNEAISYGLSTLEKNRIIGAQNVDENYDDLIYVGDQLINVLILDGGTIWNVPVVSNPT